MSLRARDAVLRAPIGSHLVRPDTRIVERPGWYQMITPSCPTSSLNEVMWSKVDAGVVDDVVAETVAEYDALGVDVKWAVGDFTEPARTASCLEHHGFGSWGVFGMVCDPRTMVIDAPADVEVRVATGALVDTYIDAMLEGWSVPERDATPTRDAFHAALAAGRRLHLVLAYVDGVVAGTSGVHLKDDNTGYLLGGNVLERFRGRGIYRALLRARLEYLAASGVELATTQARAHTAGPILERLGFETVLTYTMFERRQR